MYRQCIPRFRLGLTGNMDADPLFADPDNGDYRVKSQAGRWDPNESTWIQDEVTSPCIDAGDPSSLPGNEPFPNGGLVNMGVYGNTAEASRSFLSWSDSTTELNFHDYWPFAVGNKWRERLGYSFSQSWEITDQLTVNGFDVWTIRFRSISDHGGVVEERHYGYIDGGLYSTLNLADFGGQPDDTESSLRSDFPEFIEPGIPIHLGEYGEVLPVQGTLEQVLEVLNRSSNYTYPIRTEHFPQGNLPDALAFLIINEQYMYPLAVFGRDIGPILLREVVMREVMEVAITNLQKVNIFVSPAEVNIQVRATNLASDPIDKIEFYLDDAKAGEDVDPSDGWSYLWMNPPLVTYHIRATAVTHDGLTGDSQSVGIMICDEQCQRR